MPIRPIRAMRGFLRGIDTHVERENGVEFDEAWNTRLDCVIDGIQLPVLGRDALIRNKRASGRPKDLADLAWLERGER